MAQKPTQIHSPMSDVPILTQSRRESQSAEAMEVAALPSDKRKVLWSKKSQVGDAGGGLLERLKSKAARTVAENQSAFLASYARGGLGAGPHEDARLDQLVAECVERIGVLQERCASLQEQTAVGERRLRVASEKTVNRATDDELRGLNNFERSQQRIQEDKQEEELQRERDDAQANYRTVHRKMMKSFEELRDYKMLVRELRCLRLENLQASLGSLTDGRRIRACVCEMIRNGCHNLLQRIEVLPLSLEAWMKEVLVNSCHLEVRMQEAETRLVAERRKILGASREHVQAMNLQTKAERFESLRAHNMTTSKDSEVRNSMARDRGARSRPTAQDDGLGEAEEVAPSSSGISRESPSVDRGAGRRVPLAASAEMAALEEEIASMRRLLADIRQNTAAAVCKECQEMVKLGGQDKADGAAKEGERVLRVLVPEEIAKAAIKEMQRSGLKEVERLKAARTLRLGADELREFRSLASAGSSGGKRAESSQALSRPVRE